MKLRIRGSTRIYDAEVVVDHSVPYAFSVTLDCNSDPKSYAVRLLSRSGERYTLEIDGKIEDFMLLPQGDEVVIAHEDRVWPLVITSLRSLRSGRSQRVEMTGRSTLRAQMPGRVVRVLKQAGEKVSAGEGVVIVEAMKMQNEIVSPRTGTLIRMELAEGESVNTGDVLFEIA